jgi:Protein of unknown function (DUF3800)
MTRIYRLYIDESGDHSYGKKDLRRLRIGFGEKALEVPLDHYPELEKSDKRFLGLTGCIIETEKYRSTFHPKFEELKQRHFPHSPDEPVILHRKDIINKRGPFWRLRDFERERAFNEDLLAFFDEMDYRVITVVIDKKAHIERYQESAYHPYHYCIGAMLERYCGFLHFCNAKGDVLAESRGGTEDKQLGEAYSCIYSSGTQFRAPDFFHTVLTSKEIKLKPKHANIAGIQLADLLAHPLKQEILRETGKISDTADGLFAKKVGEIIRKKYNRHFYDGRIYGYGKVLLK